VVDGELESIRAPDAQTLPRLLRAADGKELFIIRAKFNASAGDSDGRMRFSPGSAALVVDGELHFPIGIMEGGSVFVRQVIDDMLVVKFGPGGAEVDFVYEIDPGRMLREVQPPAEPVVQSGTLFRFKRLARVDLSGKPLQSELGRSSETPGVIRKRDVEAALQKLIPGRAPAVPTGGNPAAQPATPAQPSEDGGAPGAGGSSGGAVGPDAMPQ
jgi:hypothetical protein